MSDYISREAALVAIKNLYPGIPLAKINLPKWHENTKAYMECELALEALPAADVRPVVHAIWRYKTMTVPGGNGQTYAKWSCTHCKSKSKERSNYCPNCGADMREEQT